MSNMSNTVDGIDDSKYLSNGQNQVKQGIQNKFVIENGNDKEAIAAVTEFKEWVIKTKRKIRRKVYYI